MTEVDYRLGPQEIFTLLFVTIGPIKLLGPFARATAALDAAALRALALRTAGIATVIAIVGGFVGRGMLENWQVPVMVLRLTAGMILFVVAFRLVLQPYEAAGAAPAVAAAGEPPTPARLVFPMVVTPHGVAAVIVLLAMSRDAARTGLIVGTILAVMLLNLLAMVYVRPLLRVLGMPLQLLGVVLGVLQVALSLQIALASLRGLGVLGPPP